MMDFFQEAVSGFMRIFYAVFDILWGDFITIPLPGGSSLGISLLVLILIPSGIYFTIRTRFLPFRMFPDMIRVVTEKKSEGPKGAISGVQALIVSTATRVGMGNLVGVVAAISAGGAGAVFWMWLIALLGSSTAFAEATLAQLYKEKDPLYGGYRGGPAYYIHHFFRKNKKGKKKSLLACLFALSGLVCWCGISQVIGNSVSSAFENAFQIRIFAEAFGFRQAAAGGIGAVIMNGAKRGLFSNEAGSGSAPCAAAAADISHPAKEGLLQALGVFIDTLVICSCTAMIMLLTPESMTAGLEGMDLLQTAMNYHLGSLGGVFIAVILWLFSFSTFIGILFYARPNIAYLFGDNWISQTMYKILALVMLFVGGLAAYTFVWDLGDFGVGLMTIFNMTALIPMAPQAVQALTDYEKRK